MIPTKPDRGVSTAGAAASASFGISFANEAHVMGILRDQLYSDKVLAVLREYASNAWDAHRMGNKADLPIQVTLPTWNEPTLVIRDFGPGLSHDDVFQIYTQYGASTKRGDDIAVGMLGIGSKAGFSYSDSFTVSSWHGGCKRIYTAVLDESDKGVINLVHQEDCPESETGIEIRMAIRTEDITEFQIKAKRLFQYFEPRPIINIDLPPPGDRTALPNGTIAAKQSDDHYGFNSEWIAVMGCVPYRIQVNELPVADLGDLAKALPNLAATLYFQIGDVQIAASREDLKYSKATKTALIHKISTVVDEFVIHTLATVEQAATSAWDKRVRMQVLTKLALPVPELWQEFAQEHIKLDYKPEDFTMVRHKAVATRIAVHPSVRLLLDDTGFKLEGYDLQHNDYVVRAVEGHTLDDTAKLLDSAIMASQLTGIYVSRLSALTWTKPWDGGRKPRVPNLKHRVRSFQLVPRSKYKPPYSNHWEVGALREAQPTDVYVIIEDFKAQDYDNFFDDFQADASMAASLDATMPVVYGYKSTPKKPIDKSKLIGIEYQEWRKTFAVSLMTPARAAMIDKLHWAKGPEGSWSYHSGSWFDISRSAMVAIVTRLGRRHPIVKFLVQVRAATRQIGAMNTYKTRALLGLATKAGHIFTLSTAHQEHAKILAAYPLMKLVDFGCSSSLTQFENVGPWCDYVKLVDRDHKTPTARLISLPFSSSSTSTSTKDSADDDSHGPVHAHA